MNPCEEQLAILGGPKCVTIPEDDMFKWPIITKEDEDAVLEVLRAGKMSGTDVTKQFEVEIKNWIGTDYALCYPSGTESIRAAMWACGVGFGDEIIAPSLTYWASATQALSMGAAVNFAEIDPWTLTIDPKDIEHRICPKTKAIIAVHYCAYPCDMDPIMEIAHKYNIPVIEDVSHIQGGLYKGRKLGTIGDIGAMSIMSGKSLACGEGGVIVTNNRKLYERCIAYGHYERTGLESHYNKADNQISDVELGRYKGFPIGGYKHRMHQLSSACGRVQLKHYPDRMYVIQKAMNFFWDQLTDIEGLNSHRPTLPNTDKGGWYAACGLYDKNAFGGVPLEKFVEALQAEGVRCSTGLNFPMHLHPLFHEADVLGTGQISMLVSGRDLRQGEGSLPYTEEANNRGLNVPWFKHFREDFIIQNANAFRKVANQYKKLL